MKSNVWARGISVCDCKQRWIRLDAKLDPGLCKYYARLASVSLWLSHGLTLSLPLCVYLYKETIAKLGLKLL